MLDQPLKENEAILVGIADEIFESEDFQQILSELGSQKVSDNILRGVARLGFLREQ